MPAVPETDDVATGAQTWEQQSGAISCAFERKLEHQRVRLPHDSSGVHEPVFVTPGSCLRPRTSRT